MGVGMGGSERGKVGGVGSVIDQQFLVSREVFERFGPLFDEFRPDSMWAFCFKAVLGW